MEKQKAFVTGIWLWVTINSLCKTVVLHMMVELISPQVRPLGRKDGYKVGERKDKLESMSINWNL